ncbi:L-seryl-tRNA(Sec) selenium transferase [Halalkalibacter nanhaiisediminis]|uniref:L-seryl-tRNA(Sec) selenium transferase n=1 Tax=Halalkalibacter nanhaiisediminis TaxID=688079 RepID=A0A562QRI0_9BACI|nr:L-seryl-tRNA(Sec) selenium transferase [Halalkalibacter nanhaiisediminis]TWI59283.1 L-seryl-tRNA(Sec) selenium transferase [Halalkalibacter nanhaiisediminis]
MNTIVRQLPAIHELQQDERFIAILESKQVSKEKLTEWLQETVADIRRDILEGNWKVDESIPIRFHDFIFHRLSKRLSLHSTYTLRRVINGTGTVLHTNLGRARLSEQAIKQVFETAHSYSNLEYNLELGKRGSRHDLIEELVKETTGAEAAMVVNNNAAAVYLVLTALAKDKEVIVSRGELVEIGGSFRVSSIMEESGANLKEVGTTNKTHYVDYERAITDETAMMMKVHTSNFKIIGFTKDVPVEELKPLAAKHDLLLYEDLGSGALYDLGKHGIGQEPTVAESLQNGADIVTFSGDKLLGGPQAGIIAGKKKWIDQLKKHQLARVLRVDKMTLAALEATLKEYVNEETVTKRLPTLRAVLLTKEEIRNKIDYFVGDLSPSWKVEIKQDVSQVGGGTMPEVELATFVLHLSHPTLKTQHIYDGLRKGAPAVVTRIIADQIAIDFRTIEEHEFTDLHLRLKEFD